MRVFVCVRARSTAEMDPIVLTEAQKADIAFITQLEDESAFPAAAPIFSSPLLQSLRGG